MTRSPLPDVAEQRRSLEYRRVVQEYEAQAHELRKALVESAKARKALEQRIRSTMRRMKVAEDKGFTTLKVLEACIAEVRAMGTAPAEEDEQ